MKDLKVIFMGTPDFSVPILEYLIQNTHVVLVVTKEDKIVGREQKLSFSPVKKVAVEHNVPIFQPKKIREDYETIKEVNPDIIITCAYGQILPKEVLDIPPLGCLNIHASLLPKYRGASPMQAALLNGDDKTGVTLMYMDEGMDTGDIIAKKECDINPEDNLANVHDCLSLLGVQILKENLLKVANKENERIPQKEEDASYTKLIKREDEMLDFTWPGKDIINKIRALNPYPGTYFKLDNLEIKVIKASFLKGDNFVPKKIKYDKKRMQIGCLDGYINLEIIKPFGKKEMPIISYLNGCKKDKEYVD